MAGRLHRTIELLLICVLGTGLLSGCGVQRQPAQAQPALASALISPSAPAGALPTQPFSSLSPCDAATGSRASAGGGAQVNTSAVSYNSDTNTITVGKGAQLTLAELGRALELPDALRQLAPGEWLLAANLQIDKGATLRIAAPETWRLKLRSDEHGFVWIKVLGGELLFEGVCVTSWDQDRAGYDENYDDGRSFILARDGAQMRIRDSELSYLGYEANESYGLAWRLEGTSGEILNSRLGYNFYGLYSYAASDLVIRSNEVHHSVRYGIDPHTRSNRLLIEHNSSHHNGKQGIILAEKCTNSTIRNNTSYANTLHGIVLYEHSDNNIVEGNSSYGNGLEGININNSSGNTIRNNTVYDNAKAGIGIGQKSRNNLVTGNQVRTNREDGIALYSNAQDNIIRENSVTDNARYGIYAKSADNQVADDNQLANNRKGDLKTSD